MSRNLDLTEFTSSGSHTEKRLARSTARAFAAAVSLLLITTLVIDRSTQAVMGDGTVAVSSVEAGTLSLFDDDNGRSLFELGAMVPGRPEVRCLSVTYQGTVLPVDLSLAAGSTGALSDFLDVSIERGTGGSFESCENFDAETSVYEGTLARLGDLTKSKPLAVGRILNESDAVSFRFEFRLQDNGAAMGLSSGVDFSWQVTPS